MSVVVRTFLGREVVCLLFPPAWGEQAMAIEHRTRTGVTEGLSGREERSAAGSTLRLQVSLSIQLDAAEAHALRTGLAQLGDRMVGIPLWPDLLVGGQWSGRLYDAEAIYDFSAAAIIAKGSALVAGNLYAPLVIGHLDNLPEILADRPDMGRAELQLTEDSPRGMAVAINAATASGTWPVGLDPNWQSAPTDRPLDGLQYEEIGGGRERLIEGSEKAFRWGQEAEFLLDDRDRLRSMLGFFQASQGDRVPFEMPWWFRPGENLAITPHSTKARFATNGLLVNFDTPAIGTARVRVLQVPWELGAGTAGETPLQPSRVWFYRITYEIPDVQSWRFCTWDSPLTRSADGTYQPALFVHREITEGLRLDDEVQIESAVFANNPLNLLMPYRLEGRLRLLILEGTADNPDGAQVRWEGFFRQRPASINGRRIAATAQPFGGLLERMVPRMLIQHACNWTFCSGPCGLSRSTFNRSGNLTAKSGAVVTITTGATDPAAALAGGMLEVFAGADYERRAIKAAVAVSGGYELTLERALRNAAAGQGVVFSRGCDRLPATCKALGNYANYGGFPFISEINPTLQSQNIEVASGKK